MLKLLRGEKVLLSITAFCDERGIKSAWFSGLGAVRNTELGYYRAKERAYAFVMIEENREVASFSGNIAQKDAKAFAHAHAVLSAADATLACQGGHVREAEVALTLEVFLQPLGADIAREFDDETGLQLLKL